MRQHSFSLLSYPYRFTSLQCASCGEGEAARIQQLLSFIERFSKIEVINTAVFFAFIGVLIYLMGVLWYEASRAALNIAIGLFITASVLRMYLHPGTIFR